MDEQPAPPQPHPWEASLRLLQQREDRKREIQQLVRDLIQTNSSFALHVQQVANHPPLLRAIISAASEMCSRLGYGLAPNIPVADVLRFITRDHIRGNPELTEEDVQLIRLSISGGRDNRILVDVHNIPPILRRLRTQPPREGVWI